MLSQERYVSSRAWEGMADGAGSIDRYSKEPYSRIKQCDSLRHAHIPWWGETTYGSIYNVIYEFHQRT